MKALVKLQCLSSVDSESVSSNEFEDSFFCQDTDMCVN